MKPPSPADALAFAEGLAREAGQVLLEHDAPTPRVAPRMKGRIDPVTDADLASERHIVAAIRSTWPEHAIVAEEETRDPDEGRPTWYVDPLDGTVNFSQAHPFFAVSLALYDGQQGVAGVVHAPRLGETFSAAAGLGCRLEGERVTVSTKTRLDESILATGFAYGRREHANDNVATFADMVLRVRGLRRCGSAAIDLAFVASGRYDGYWEPHLNCFDVAAGALLVAEAGGVVTDMSGGSDWLHGRHILAAGPGLHGALAEAVSASLAGKGPL